MFGDPRVDFHDDQLDKLRREVSDLRNQLSDFRVDYVHPFDEYESNTTDFTKRIPLKDAVQMIIMHLKLKLHRQKLDK